MKKVVTLIILLIGVISLSKINVNAEVFKTTQKFDNVTIDYLDDQSSSVDCSGLFTEDGLNLIKEILNYIRIIAPILLILLVALDLGTAVMAQDNDALAKATKKIVPRLIGVALLFFVPTIVRAILSIKGISDSITIPDDPLCHAMITEKVDNNYNIVY
jgi:hypothetical protein